MSTQAKFSVGERVMIRSKFTDSNCDDALIIGMRWIEEYGDFYTFNNKISRARMPGWCYMFAGIRYHFNEIALRPRPKSGMDWRDLKKCLNQPRLEKA